MVAMISWISIGVLFLFLLIGLLTGLIRGLKRSSMHLLFFLASFLLAFCLTKVIAQVVLQIKLNIDGTTQTINQYIISMVQEMFDLSAFSTAMEFVEKLPIAIVSPIIFMVLAYLCYFVFDIIYLIVARVSFGKKKLDFQKHKPHRAYGMLVGMAEGFLALFLTFAPLTALTNTYSDIVAYSQSVASAQEIVEDTNLQKTAGEFISEMVPEQISVIINAYNNSAVGKIAGAGRIDYLLFDGMSNFKIDGQKIQFRKELVDLVKTYDQAVVAINNITLEKYEKIDFDSLKATVSNLLDNGIFKKVVADTIKEVVIKFDEIKESLGFEEDLPELAEDVIAKLKTTFQAENFDMAKYLKHDILKFLDVFETLYKSDLKIDEQSGESYYEKPLVNKFELDEDFAILDIVDLISENEDKVKSVLGSILSLNIVDDVIEPLEKFASQQFASLLESDKEIAVNLSKQAKDNLIDQLFDALDKIIALKDYIDLEEIINSQDYFDAILNADGLTEALVPAGEALDSIRELDVLVLPAKVGVRDNKVYVLDNILDSFGFKLLSNDKIYDKFDVFEEEDKNADGSVTINSYSRLFKFLAPAVKVVADLDVLNTENSFDTILQNILNKLKNDESALAKMMIPFYQLENTEIKLGEDTKSLKGLIFDEVVNTLKDNTSNILDVDAVKAETKEGQNGYIKSNAVDIWKREFSSVGELLNSLNKGENLQTNTKSYLKRILDGEDLDAVLKSMIENEDISAVLNNMFDSTIFGGITNTVFDKTNELVAGITGNTAPAKDLSMLKTTKASVISVITQLLDGSLDSIDTTNISEVGRILDILKINAYNNGNFNGVFNNVFAHLIFYMTGDNINEATYSGTVNYVDNYETIRDYLNVDTTQNYNGYYLISYEQKFAEIEEVVKFANDLKESLKDIDVTTNESDYIEVFKEVIDNMSQSTDAEKIEVIENLKDLIDANSDQEIFTDEQKTAIENALSDSSYQISDELRDAILQLIGVEASQE